MQRRHGTTAVSVILILLASSARGDDTARALVKQALEALPKASFTARLELTTNDEAARVLEMRHKLVDGARATYLEVVAPADLAGIRFLFLHRIDQPPRQYIKVAAARRHVLVSEEARFQPFLDSAFYVADVIEPELDAFEYRLVGDGEVQERQCQFVEARPKNPEKQVYGKTVVAIDPVDHLILRRELYSLQGELVKVVLAERVEKIDGHWTVLRQRMKSLVDRRTSVLQVNDIEYGVDIPDEVFHPDYLLR